ncbi:hypothetical protein [Leucobacter sp. 1207-22]|uniref:hypothetical protein n=1 Tax=Leucobacter sp. 1207-22 TaxID=2604456 RepID=UPI00406446D9
MTFLSRHAGLIALATVLALTGCTAPGSNVSGPQGTTDQQKVNSDLTWEEAKTATQEMELEIVDLIPAELVINVDQHTKGVLLSCDNTSHSWTGATTVTLTPGTDIESIVKDIEAHYREAGTEISVDRDVDGNYRIQLLPPVPGENYIIAKDVEDDHLRIASGSECFTLPEGVYPGGEF